MENIYIKHSSIYTSNFQYSWVLPCRDIDGLGSVGVEILKDYWLPSLTTIFIFPFFKKMKEKFCRGFGRSILF